MPIETTPNSKLKYYLIAFDAEGRERTDDPAGKMSDKVVEALKNEPITDVFMLSHGWQGDVPAARRQYNNWIEAMASCQDDIEEMKKARPGFHPLMIGVHWPSLAWGE